MNEHMDRIVHAIRGLEREAVSAKQRAGLRYGFERGRVVFEAKVARRHRRLKRSLSLNLLRARPLVALTSPLIYSLIMLFFVADLWASLFQATQVKRASFSIARAFPI